MNIIEVKNNLVKLSYEEDIVLGAFLKISDLKNSYIAQILHLEASRIGKTAIARLIFNFKAGIIQAYDGSIPTIQSEIEVLNPDFIANIFDKTNPLIVGKLNQSQTDIIVSANLLKDKPIICAEKSYQYNLLLKNITKQNEIENRKTVIFDLTGELSNNSICATQNFKIPLNKNSIDYIFDRGFEDLTKENKAFIQDIFTELNEYIKTVEFIPFNNFNAVIDYEFKRTQKLQLIILRNRLLQFEKLGIFAETDKDFKISPDSNLRGMMLAATVAAGKAGTGNINEAKNLLWAQGQEVSDVGINELKDLGKYLGKPQLAETGFAEVEGYDLIGLPAILVDKPKTLVGMGDTISSISLIGAR